MGIEVTRKSMITGKLHTLVLDTTQKELDQYVIRSTILIQDAFPQLSAEEREFIKTGITPEEWLKYIEEGTF